MSMQLERETGRRGGWRFAAAAAVAAAFFLVLTEWLFLATKPSFLSVLDWPDRLLVLLAAPLVLVLPLLASLLLAQLLGLADPRLGAAGRAAVRFACAALVASSGLLAADNFTLTLFGFGVRSTAGWLVLPYLALIAGLLAWVYLRLRQGEQKPGPRAWTGVLLLLPVVSAGAAVLSAAGQGPSSAAANSPGAPRPGAPNVLLLSGDGLNAENLSVYGYPRETTPFLSELAAETLFCENAFSNASSTGGSLVSVLTGKLPTRTRVVYPPDILRGRDAFEHLPLLLRNRGYRSFHVSIRHYGDPYDYNMRHSFEVSNFEAGEYPRATGFLGRWLGQEAAYFLGHTHQRVRERLLHVARIRPMADVYAEVTRPERRRPSDPRRLEALDAFLRSDDPRPFFAQVHLMGTHGPRFRPSQPRFSSGSEQERPWMPDFYDDAVADFDRRVGQVVDRLRESDQLESTVLVVFSDHAQRSRTGERIPLMFRFPGAAHAGRVRENVQLLDIAPTVAGYLGIGAPAWMEGRDLLSKELDPLEPILIATQRTDAAVKQNRVYWIDPREAGPPFYSLGKLRAVVCQGLFTMDLTAWKLSQSRVAGHTAPCAELPGKPEMARFLLDHLDEAGYETASFGWPLSSRGDLLAAIETASRDERARGTPRGQMEAQAWRRWGREVVAEYNRRRAAGERVPHLLEQMVEWARQRGKVREVEGEEASRLVMVP